MPNMQVYQTLPSNLRTRMYGNNGGTDVEIAVDSTGAVYIAATALDIRDITNATDSILIYGNDGSQNRVVLTDTTGKIKTIHYPDFTEATETLATATAYAVSATRTTSQFNSYTYFVLNQSNTNTADVKLEISPDDVNYLLDGTVETVPVSTAILLTPNRFLKYAHFQYKSTTAGSDTTLVATWDAWTT